VSQPSRTTSIIATLLAIGMVLGAVVSSINFGASRRATAQSTPAWYNYGAPSGQPPSAYILDIDMIGGAEGWLIASQGLAKLESSGWQFQTSTVSLQLEAPVSSLDMLDPSNGWAVGHGNGGGTIWRFQDNAWSIFDASYPKELHDVDMVSASDGWAVGLDGHIIHFDGSQWLQVQSPTSSHLTTISMYSATSGWAAGDNGTMLHYDGTSWVLQNFPSGTYILDVLGVSSNEAWAVGGPSEPLFHYSAGGWTVVSNPSSMRLFSLSGSASEWWAAGDEFIHFSNGTMTLEGLPETLACGGFSDWMSDIEFVDDNNVWAGGRCGELRHYTGLPRDLIIASSYLPMLMSRYEPHTLARPAAAIPAPPMVVPRSP